MTLAGCAVVVGQPSYVLWGVVVFACVLFALFTLIMSCEQVLRRACAPALTAPGLRHRPGQDRRRATQKGACVTVL